MELPKFPPEIEALVERVSQDDAKWFKRHPKERFRYREYVPGEFWPHEHEIAASGMRYIDAIGMQVEQLEPGMRIRRPIFMTKAKSPPEGMAF